MRKGFTLVELSIVLVIIGLLIGGILVAQSMVGTARIQALTRQLGQFDSAVNNFKTRYNQLPGDSNLMNSKFANEWKGNNDGIINCGPLAPADFNFNIGEIALFWLDLQSMGLSNPVPFVDDFSGNNSGLGEANYTPQAVAGKNAVFVVFGSGTPGINYYGIGDRSNGGYGIIYNNKSFTPAEVLALDSKIDDGKADGGNVKGSDQLLPTQMQNETGSIQSGTGCASGSAYSTANTTEQCTIRVRIGSTTGTLY